METLRTRYEVEFWDSPETAFQRNDCNDYHSIMSCDELDYATEQYKKLILKHEHVLFNIIEIRVLQEYHKTSIS